MKQKVIIVGQYYNNRLALLRPLGEVGYEISIVVLEHYPKRPIDSYSKYVTNCYICPEETEEALIHILMTYCSDERQKVLLIPSDDFSVFVLDKNYNKLEKFFLFPNIHERQGAVVEWMDKEKQKVLAREIGLNVANSRGVKIINGRYSVPLDITYPCFTKIQSFALKAKRILHQCDNEQELKKTLDSICEQHKDIDVMIEDFKFIEREYAVVGFSNGKDVVIPGVIEILLMGRGNGIGVAQTGEIVPVTRYEELIKKFKRYVIEIGFIGIFDIDFYLCNNEFYFGELNLRFGGSGYVVIRKGVNLPVMMTKTLLGEDLDGLQKEINNPSTYANEKVCLQNWYAGYMSTKEFLRIIKSSDFLLINDEKDPVPFKMYKRIFFIMRLKRAVKKIIGKLN